MPISSTSDIKNNQLEKLKILFVDDERGVLTSLQTSFAEDYDVYIANSGEEALEVFYRVPDLAIVITDQKMPGIDGVELITRLYHQNPEVIRIIITGHADLDDVISAINKGHIYQYVQKPVEIVPFQVTIEQAATAYRLSQENKKLTQQLHVNNQELKKINDHLQKSEIRLRSLSAALISAQENERKRISWELHDEVGPSLVAVKLQLKVLENQLPVPIRTEMGTGFDQIRLSVNQIMENARRLSQDLSPLIISDLGVDAAIDTLVKNHCRYYKMSCHFSPLPVAEHFDSDEQRLIYRLIQEGFNNIGRHSAASATELLFTQQDHLMVINLNDNGQGFQLSTINSHHGIGLSAMRERVEMLNGQLTIKTQPGEGTHLTFSLPIPRATHQGKTDVLF